MTTVDRHSGSGSADPAQLTVPIVVRGTVEAGDQRGRTLGFPTANIRLTDDDAVPDGVYGAVYVRPDGRQFPAAVSIGRRSTFYENHGGRLLEAHLLGFSGSLVGESAEIRLLWHPRAQRTFTSTAELIAQLRRDIELARSLLCELTD